MTFDELRNKVWDLKSKIDGLYEINVDRKDYYSHIRSDSKFNVITIKWSNVERAINADMVSKIFKIDLSPTEPAYIQLEFEHRPAVLNVEADLMLDLVKKLF